MSPSVISACSLKFRRCIRSRYTEYVREIRTATLGMQGLQWQTVVRPDEFVVLYFDSKDGAMRNPTGEHLTHQNGILHVFSDLADARRHCAGRVAANAQVGCAIYDATAKLLETVEDEKWKRHRHGSQAMWRYALWASFLCLGGVACIVLDWRSGWKLIFGPIIAVKLFVLAVFLIGEGVAGLLYYRRKHLSESAEER